MTRSAWRRSPGNGLGRQYVPAISRCAGLPGRKLGRAPPSPRLRPGLANDCAYRKSCQVSCAMFSGYVRNAKGLLYPMTAKYR